GDVQRHLYPAVGRGGDGLEEGFVGNEVGADDLQTLLGVMRHGDKQPQVRLGGESGPGGDELHELGAGVLLCGGETFRVDRGVDEVQRLAGFGVPVDSEDRV